MSSEARLRKLLADIVSELGSQHATAKALGVTQPTVQRVLVHGRGLGGKLSAALLDYEAKNRRKKTEVDMIERYPNRATAIKLLVESGEEAELCTAAAPTALQSDEDPPVAWWYERIKLELQLIQKPWKRLSRKVLTQDDA